MAYSARGFGASTGQIALDSLEALAVQAQGRVPPGVAIVDLDLGTKLADLEAIRQLQRHDFQPIPVIAVASSATMRTRAPAWAAAAPAVWAAFTPYDLEEEREELVRHVNRVLTSGPTKATGRRKVRVPFYAQVRFRPNERPGSASRSLTRSSSRTSWASSTGT